MGQVKHSLRKKKSHLNSFNNINIEKSLPKIKKRIMSCAYNSFFTLNCTS